jgi:hypothetical protein
MMAANGVPPGMSVDEWTEMGPDFWYLFYERYAIVQESGGSDTEAFETARTQVRLAVFRQELDARRKVRP